MSRWKGTAGFEEQRGAKMVKREVHFRISCDEHHEAGNPGTISSNFILAGPDALRCVTSARHVAVGNPGTKSQGPFITRLGTHSFSDFPFPEKRNKQG